MEPINYGPLRDWLSLADAVGPLVLFGLMAVFAALFVLQKRGVRIGERRLQLSEATRDLLGGLVMALIGPVIIVSGAGHYILQAGTGYFPVPSDFRNSQEWVDGLYVFMAIAAPLWVVFCLAVSASALRRRRLQHAKPGITGPPAIEDNPTRRHYAHHKRDEAD